MIHLDGPHMGLNDSRSTNKVQMWNTWGVLQNETVDHMIGWVAEVAKKASGGKLKNMVFRCHGAPAFLLCGAGIRRSDASKFTAWRGLIDKIWFSACQVAYITPPASAGVCAPPSSGTCPLPTGSGPASGDGNMFCSEIAQAAQCLCRGVHGVTSDRGQPRAAVRVSRYLRGAGVVLLARRQRELEPALSVDVSAVGRRLA
jgi:hypothetical protein